MGDILQQKGYYDAMITQFEEIREKRTVAHEEVSALEKQQTALSQKVDELTRRLNALDTSIVGKAHERDTYTGFIEDLEAGGPRAKRAMMRLARVTLTVEQRAQAMRQEMHASILEGVEPTSPKLGSSKKMHHEAVQAKDFQFLYPGGAPPVTVRCYSGALPGSDSSPGGGLPVLVYYHGEGYVAGDLDSHDWLCRSLAAMARVTVVAVDYRRAPEDRFPAAFEDAYAALRWVADGGIGERPRRLGVAGDCCGAGLAAACCLRARDDEMGPEVHLQVLIYPWLDLRPDAPALVMETHDVEFQDNLFWFRHLYTPLDAPPETAAEDSGTGGAADAKASKQSSLTAMLRPGSRPSSSRPPRPANGKPPSLPSRSQAGSKPPSLPGSRAPSQTGAAPPTGDAPGSAAGSETSSRSKEGAQAEGGAEDGAQAEDAAEEKLEVVEEEPAAWYLDPRASPVLARSLAGLPRAFIAYAEGDPVSGDAIAYAERLVEEGGKPEAVHTLHLEGPIGHGFAKRRAAPEASQVLSAVAAFASAALKM